VTASTGINSLSVALGSTFGAFLALGVIVAFVMIAKYQYIRRKRKSIQIQLLHRCDESFDSLPAATADRLTHNEEDEDDEEDTAMEMRPTVNGTIELKRLSHQPTLGRVPDAEDALRRGPGDHCRVPDDDDAFASVPNNNDASRRALDAPRRVPDDEDDDDGAAADDRVSSDFSADIILHDTVVHAAASGYPHSVHSQGGPDGSSDGDAAADTPQRLVLDSATCAGSFILANDEPTGRTYSLLVPITSPAAQPFLAGPDAQAGGPRLLRISGGGGGGGGASATGGKVGGGGSQSIVRLKLRKHATVDYSSLEEDSGQIPPLSVGPRSSVAGAADRTLVAERTGIAVHRVSVCCGHQANDRTVDQQKAGGDVHETASSERRITRSLSIEW